MIEILEHHVLNIRIECRGNANIAKISAQRTTRLSRLYYPSGEPVYPNLQTGRGRKRYSQQYRKMAEAVKRGEFRVKPDLARDGSHNKDGLCRLCGNHNGRRCDKK